ncbi:MAG: hypothetical protein M3081_22715 [Gemmatimonadota bacterium]|nr:hypothetical protein [Gemmatimonadota bacterium]
MLASSLAACEGWHVASLGPATVPAATLDKENVTPLGARVTVSDSEYLVVLRLRASGWSFRPALLFNSASTDSVPMLGGTYDIAFREHATRNPDGQSLAFRRNVPPRTGVAPGINPSDREYFDYYDRRDGMTEMPVSGFTNFGSREPEIHLLLITTRRPLGDSAIVTALDAIGSQRSARDIADKLAARLNLGAEWSARDYDRP